MTTSPLAPTAPAPRIGDLIPLGSVVIKLDVAAETTMPDTPNGYTATAQVMADQGDLDTSALTGRQGPPGEIGFAVREQIDPYINSPTDLKPLSNSPADIGKYYLLREFNSYGVEVGQWAYIWYGSSYRRLMMGTFGPPGPVPKITPSVELLPPLDSAGKPTPSRIITGGPRLDPSWLLELAVPGGPMGPIAPLALFPDVDETPPPASGDLLGFSGTYTEGGEAIFSPLSIDALLPTTYSMPESAFSAFTGVTQSARVGSFTLPAQPFPWTPIVWGHIGMGGLNLSANPLRIGCQVLLGDPVNGLQVARGLGTTLGSVAIAPHYSSSVANNGKNQSITPRNRYAVVPANHTNPAAATLYVNLWNDGQLGAYNFTPGGAQLFVQVLPMGPIAKPQMASGYPSYTGEGTMTATGHRVIS